MEKRAEAQASVDKAIEAGNAEDVDKFSRRTIKVSKEHNEQCRKLLALMGIPFVEAPCEAEAQCAALAKDGLVFASASEDMDTITFGTPILLRQLTASEAKKLPVVEFNMKKILEELDFTMDQFIDLCILLGCDYCESIRGIGPKKAVELMKKHGNIETILENIDQKKYIPPVDWTYKEARNLFVSPLVHDSKDVTVRSFSLTLDV